ncbi:unnamed protein product, partial [Rotaria socialis]
MYIFIVWLRDEELPAIARLLRLISAVTNLTMETAEELQMSDVEWGGATIFPVSGGYIAPKKISAAFWYNLHASGETDYRTLHA